MKQVAAELMEAYIYDSYVEFVEHYSKMLDNGFRPNSESSRPTYYTNTDLDSYYAQYYKKV